jgi:hypothetical protein
MLVSTNIELVMLSVALAYKPQVFMHLMMDRMIGIM